MAKIEVTLTEQFDHENWDAADDVLAADAPESILDLIDDSEFVPEIGHVYQLENGERVVVTLRGQLEFSDPFMWA